jgi:hypothetical protein
MFSSELPHIQKVIQRIADFGEQVTKSELNIMLSRCRSKTIDEAFEILNKREEELETRMSSLSISETESDMCNEKQYVSTALLDALRKTKSESQIETEGLRI